MEDKKKASASGIVGQKDKKTRDENYKEYVKQITPKYSLGKNMAKAFLVGGLICLIGQGFINYYMSLGADMELAKAYNTVNLLKEVTLFLLKRLIWNSSYFILLNFLPV